MLRSVDECNEDDDLAKSSAIEDRESGNERETTRIDETLDDNRFRGKTAIEVASESTPSKLNKDGKVEYNVKSKGYEDENDTWEEVTMN